jgi:hypothetical protein
LSASCQAVVKEATRTFRGPTGEMVTEVDRTLAPMDGKLGLEFLARALPG